jgi:hypothetical protein
LAARLEIFITPEGGDDLLADLVAGAAALNDLEVGGRRDPLRFCGGSTWRLRLRYAH